MNADIYFRKWEVCSKNLDSPLETILQEECKGLWCLLPTMSMQDVWIGPSVAPLRDSGAK